MRPVPGIEVSQQPIAALFACLLVNEAANDGIPGMTAVAQVVLNRLHRPKRFGTTLRDVILQPYAFSCLNRDVRDRFLDIDRLGAEAYRNAEAIVEQAMNNGLPDTVGDATHYCTNGLHGTLPLWDHDDTARIAAGHHPAWYSSQEIEAGNTVLIAVVGRQTFARAA